MNIPKSCGIDELGSAVKISIQRSHFSSAQATSACFLVAWSWLYMEETEGSIEECTGIFLVLFQKGNADSHLEIDFKTQGKQFENTIVYENTNKVFF